MPEVRYIGGSVYDLRGGPTWTAGDVHEVGDGTAARLTGRHDFELVANESGGDGGTGLNQQDSTDDSGMLVKADDKSDAMLIDAGVCPWCDEYEGDAVGQHASAAHPDLWNEYKEQR